VFFGANPLQRRQHQLHQQHQLQRGAEEEEALEEYHEPQLRHGGSIMTSFPPLFEDAGALGAGGEFHGAMHRLGVASGSNPMQRQQQQQARQRSSGNLLLPPAAAASRFPALFSPPAEAAAARAALGGAGSGSRRGFANVNPLYASSSSPAQPFSPLDRQHHYTSLTAEEQEAARAPSSGHHRASVRQLHSTARVTSRVKGAGSGGEYY
jgi:hypothetical protein